MIAPAQQMEAGQIVLTDETCICDNRRCPGIPTLVWKEGIDEYASDFFRYVRIERGVRESTCLEYAKILREFLAYCRSRGVRMDEMSDDFLTSWINSKSSHARATPKRINECLRRAFDFLKWLERTHRIRHVVGIYEPVQMTGLPEGYIFPVSAQKRPLKPKPGSKVAYWDGWVTTLSLKGQNKPYPPRHTPVEAEIRRIHMAVIHRRHGVRDALTFSWAEETGARRADIIGLNIEDIPDYDVIDSLMGRDEQFALSVVRKGRSEPSMLYPTIDLLLRTRSYIENERRMLVASKADRVDGYDDPPAVFLSGQTGQRLTKDALTKLSSHAFASAKVDNASLHRLRARFAVNAIEALLDAIFIHVDIPNLASWEETIATKLSELMGHSSRESLGPYIQFALGKRMKGTVATRAREAETRLRNAEIALEATINRAKLTGVILELADAARDNRAADVHRLCDHLRSTYIL